jgi:ATP-dependent helicase HrpB
MPPAAAVAQARELLVRLGALKEIKNDKLKIKEEQLSAENSEAEKLVFNSPFLIFNSTSHGRQLAKLGLPPRLGHLVVRGTALGHSAAATALAALLAERDLLRWATPNDPRPLPPDLRLRLETLASGRAPLAGLALHHATLQRVRDVARHLQSRQHLNASSSSHLLTSAPVGLLTALAYPDRLAQREAPDRLRLVTGQRVALRTEDVDPQAEFFAVAHLAGTASAPRATLAAPLDREELEAAFGEQIATTEEVRFDPATQRVSGRRMRRLGALLLDEKVIGQPNAELVAQALLGYLQEAGLAKLNWTPAARQLQQRLEFVRQYLAPAGPAGLASDGAAWPAADEAALLADLPSWLGPHLAGLKSLDQVQRLDLYEPLLARLPGGWAQRQELDRLAPTHLEVPSGSLVALDYTDPAAPVLAVKLQELFGLTETPTVAGGRVPLLLHLLSPGGRPAQVTRDLRSFWEKGYFEVRKDLKGKYPRHPWPDEPMKHVPTRLTKKRLGTS